MLPARSTTSSPSATSHSQNSLIMNGAPNSSVRRRAAVESRSAASPRRKLSVRRRPVAALADNDDAAQAEETAQSQRLSVMQGQIDTLGQRLDALAQ